MNPPSEHGVPFSEDDNFPVLQPSQEVISKQGVARSYNTDKSTRTGINAWCSIQLRNFSLSYAEIQSKDESWLYEHMKKEVMPDAVAQQPLSNRSIPNLNVSLGEFVEHVRKADGKILSPASLVTYLESINRWLQKRWELKVNIMKDAMFKDDNVEFLHVADRKA